MCARHNHSQSNIKSLKNHKESHSKHFCCPCSSHLAHCFDRSVPLFPMSELISSDEEVQVEWNKTALQTGLRTIHNEPGASSFSSSRILDSVCFALAKPVETGPCPEAQDNQDYAGQSDGPGLGLLPKPSGDRKPPMTLVVFMVVILFSLWVNHGESPCREDSFP